MNTRIPRTWPARVAYLASAGLVGATVASLTLLKSSFSIGGLWDAQAHNTRSIDLVPFNGFIDPPIWYGPITNTVGNVALFIPVGVVVVLLWGAFGQGRTHGPDWRRRAIARAALIGGVISLGIEVTQFVLARGYSDVDDLLLNTVGATLGGWLAVRLELRRRRFLLGLIWGACAGVLAFMGLGALRS